MNLTHDEIVRRRAEFRLSVNYRIGWEHGPYPTGKRLSPEGSINYLRQVGVPESAMPTFGATTADYIDEHVEDIDVMILDGYGKDSDGFYFLAETKPEVQKHKTLCAHIAHRFLRKGRNVAWESHSNLVALEKQAMMDGHDDDTLDMKFQADLDLYDLRAVYELLVLTDVKCNGVTAFDERAVTRIIGDRAASELPTLVLVSPVDAFEDGVLETMVGRCLSKLLTPIGL